MDLHRTKEGFALYKEKTQIGFCTLTPAPKGAAIAALCIQPQWRRKGYGSYFLKEILRSFAGYDREQATVFTAPLPADAAELAFWARFGFAAEGPQLVRRRTPDLTAVRFVQDFLAARLGRPRLKSPAATRPFCAGSPPRRAGCWASTSSPRPLHPPGSIWSSWACPPPGMSCTAKATQTFYRLCSQARQMR